MAIFAGQVGGQPQARLPVDPGELVHTFEAFNNLGHIPVTLVDTTPSGLSGAVNGVNHIAPLFWNAGAGANEWNLTNLGQVYGVTLDGAPNPNIYVTAASTTHIYPFTENPGALGPAGAGGVYRLDGTTGAICALVSLPNDGVSCLGNITYSLTTNSLYASNFADGLIYRVPLGPNPSAPICPLGGVPPTTYDHGVSGRPAEGLPAIADNGAPGITQYGRRVWGVAVHRGENRLYYGVWWDDTSNPNANENNEVWSVGLDAAGNPVGATANREITLPLFSGNYSNPPAGLNFTPSGTLLVGERTYGTAHQSRLLEYTGGTNTWVPQPPNKWLVGISNTSCSGAGEMACDGKVWSAGDGIVFQPNNELYGLIRIPAGGNSTHAPPTSQSIVIDSDQDISSGQDKTQIGSLAFRQNCASPCERITLRSGQVNGVPGQPGQLVPGARRHPTVGTGGAPLSGTPFNNASWFTPAQAVNPVYVIAPLSPPWTSSLACDPQARWINWAPNASSSRSVLYAIPFTVHSRCISRATLSICYAVDDTLGDQLLGGPNSAGVYINGVATSISGGSYASQTTVTGVDITAAPIVPGTNWLYLYQRDGGQVVSGLIYSATIDIECCPCEQPATNITYNAGIHDNFAPAAEPMTLSPALAAWWPGNAPNPVNFDVNVSDRSRLHSFRNLPDGITAAKLHIHMRGVSGLSCNDSIHLGFNAPAGPFAWGSRIGQNNCGGPPVQGLTPVWTTGSDQVFTLDLAALPVAGGTVDILPLLCHWKNTLDVYVQDDTSVDDMRLEITTCCNGKQTAVRNAGKCDDYVLPTETTWRKPAFNAIASNWRQFDTQACDRPFGHTFTGLPPGITDARLTICMKPFCFLASNDSINFEYLGIANTPPNSFAAGYLINNNGAVLTPNPGVWDPPNGGGCYTIDLKALNLLGYMADRDFDVYIQDDTDVDCMRLSLRYCSDCNRDRLIVWVRNIGVLMDPSSGAVLDPNFIRGDLYGMRRPQETIRVGEELWVSDQLADTIFRFSLEGELLSSITGGLDDLRGMEYANGVVYVANLGTDNGAPGEAVIMLSPDGSRLGHFPATNPWDVHEFRGELLVSDISIAENVDRYTYEGVFLGHLIDSDGITGVDFPTQIASKTSEAESTLLIGGFSPPDGIFEYDAEGNLVSRIDVGSEVRGVTETGNGDLLWTSDSGLFLRDRNTGVSTLLAQGAARWLSFIGDGGTTTPAEFCYADCDNSGALDIFDFLCFQNAYDLNEPFACQCDESTGPDLCDIFDFLCYQNAYAAGCP